MATVFVVDERLFVKDGEGMSQERRERLKLAAWSILVNRRQPDDLESVGEEPESNRPVRLEPLPRHGCPDREEIHAASNERLILIQQQHSARGLCSQFFLGVQ